MESADILITYTDTSIDYLNTYSLTVFMQGFQTQHIIINKKGNWYPLEEEYLEKESTRA